MHVKINLPDSRESYESGNGEGCWAIIEGAAATAYEEDGRYDPETGAGLYKAILDNDSWYYPGLVHGTEVPIEMRGPSRPVVPIAWLADNYGKGA